MQTVQAHENHVEGFSKLIPEAHYQKPGTPLLGLVLRLLGMSTKQPAVAMVSLSNQQCPLSLLLPPLVKSGPSGIPFSKSSEQVQQT